MKRLALAVALLVMIAPALFAQNHGEVGVFFDYLRFQPTTPAQNFYGVGGRVAFNVHKYTQIEAEMSYDFERKFNTGNATTGFFRSGFRILDGLFGVKFQPAGAIRPFFTVKGGFVNFSVTNAPATAGTITSAISDVPTGNTRGALYPAAGIELFGGPFGIRAEIGDLVFFQNGGHNNLRITVGPQIRF
jgi:hypothetical protein